MQYSTCVVNMRIEFEGMEGIRPDGSCKDGGAVETSAGIRMGLGNGCGIPSCHCSDGYWISVCSEVRHGKRIMARVIFENKKEMRAFFKQQEMSVLA